ncbi:MAG: LPD38 domain-containing protein, partial [Bacteroidota bacterium]
MDAAAIDPAAGVRQFPIEPPRQAPPLATEGTASGQMVPTARGVADIAPPALGEALDATARQQRGLGSTTVPQQAVEPAPAPAPPPRMPSEPISAAHDAALSAHIKSGKPLTAEALAKSGNMTPQDAGRALQQAAMQGRIIIGKNGEWRRPSVMRNRPPTVIEFIASIGGIRDDGGELKARDLTARSTMTRFGPLVRKNGLPPDKVRERLVEAGYIEERGNLTGGLAQTTPDDVYAAIDRQLAGETVVSRQDQNWQADVDATKAAERSADELENRFTPDERDLITNYFVNWQHAESLAAFLRDNEMTAASFPPGEIRLVSDLMDEGLTADAAVERAALMSVEGDFADLSDAAQALAKSSDTADIPGWEPDNGLSGKGAAAESPRAGDAGDGSGPGSQGLSGADGGAPRNAGPPQTETGADGKPQTVLTGAGRASDAQLAQRGADAPLRPSKAQNFIMDEGLFGDSMNQGEMFMLAQGKFPGSLARDQNPLGTPGKARTDVALTRLQDIAERLSAALEAVAVRQGKIGNRKAVGSYNPQTGVIRVRTADDFNVLTHELGHHVEASIGAPLKALMKTHAAELEPMAYAGVPPPLQLEEGFAEFMRLMATNPAYARLMAPKFNAELRQMLASERPDVLTAIDDAARARRAWLEQPSADAVASTIVTGKRPSWLDNLRKDIARSGLSGTIIERLHASYTAYFDDINPFSRTVRELARVYKKNHRGQALDIRDMDNPMKIFRAGRNSYQASWADIVDGVHRYRDYAGKPASASLRDAIVTALGKPNVLSGWNEAAIRDFGAYLWSRRALGEWERFDQGLIPNRPDKLTRGDHRQNIEELETAYPGFKAGASMVHDWARALWTKKFEAGLITREQFTEGLAIKDYVPGLRAFDKEADAKTGGSPQGARAARSSIVKRFRGSDRDVINPVDSLMADAHETAMAIARNDALKALDRLARIAGPGGGAIAERIPSHEIRAMNVDPLEAVERAAREAGMAKADIVVLRDALEAQIGDDKVALFRPDMINEKGEPIAFFRDGGELKALRLADGDLGRQMVSLMNGMPPPQKDFFVESFAFTAQAARLGVTLDPIFQLKNLFRDQVQSILFYGRPFERAKSLAAGAADEALQRDAARQYARAGGVMGGVYTATAREAAALRDIKALERVGWQVARLPSWKGLMQVSEFTESANRLGLMRTFKEEAMARGLDENAAIFEAAYRARDHADFSRHGSRMMAIGRMIPFLRASLVGSDKFTRQTLVPLLREAVTAEEQRARAMAVGTWARVSAAVTAWLGVHALMADDEYYREASSLRANHFVFRVGDTFVAVPKPYDTAVFFNTAEAVFDAWAKNNPNAARAWREALFRTTLPPDLLQGNPLLKTMIEMRTGKDVFRGTSVVPEDVAALEPWQQATARTSEIAKKMGEALNVAPVWVDQLITNFTTSTGKAVLSMYDYAFADRPSPGWDDFVITSGFIKDASRGATSTRAFWELISARNGTMTGAAASYQAMIEAGDPAKAADFLALQDAPARAWIAIQAVKEPKMRRLHPMSRAREAVRAVNALRKELHQADVATAAGAMRVSAADRRAADDVLEDLGMAEARNALVLSG